MKYNQFNYIFGMVIEMDCDTNLNTLSVGTHQNWQTVIAKHN